MANRIKDALAPELYEYYKNHRSKYKRFTSDLTLLQAKLFKDMVDNKVFPAAKKKHGWEYECDCTTWLNSVTSKITTFNDFRKLYKNRLKDYKFKSPEYYAECERIVAENDVEFVKASMRAQSMRNYVARNYNAPMPSQENVQIVKKEKQDITSSISGYPGILPHDDKYDYRIEEEKSYGGYTTIPYIVTKHCKENVYSLQNWDCESVITNNLHITWEEFWRKYNDYIAGMNANSLNFKYQCYAIYLEEQYRIKTIPCCHEREGNQADSSYDDRFDYDIIREDGYRSKGSIPYIVTKHCKSDLRYFEGDYYMWDSELNVKRFLNLTWNEFYKKYNFCLSGMNEESFEFKCQCLAIILEEMRKKDLFKSYPKSIGRNDTWIYRTKPVKTRETSDIASSASNMLNPIIEHKEEIENIASQSGIIWNEDDFECGRFCLASIFSFFVFGGIAYVFKHIICLLWCIMAFILYGVVNIVYCIFAALFCFDIGTGICEPIDFMIEPIQIWQIGGWIYGTFVVVMVCGAIYNKIKKIEIL